MRCYVPCRACNHAQGSPYNHCCELMDQGADAGAYSWNRHPELCARDVFFTTQSPGANHADGRISCGYEEQSSDLLLRSGRAQGNRLRARKRLRGSAGRRAQNVRRGSVPACHWCRYQRRKAQPCFIMPAQFTPRMPTPRTLPAACSRLRTWPTACTGPDTL